MPTSLPMLRRHLQAFRRSAEWGMLQPHVDQATCDVLNALLAETRLQLHGNPVLDRLPQSVDPETGHVGLMVLADQLLQALVP